MLTSLNTIPNIMSSISSISRFLIMSGQPTRNYSSLKALKSKNWFLLRHGFGNWNDIADFIGTNKSREDVEEHYQNIYLGGKDYMPVRMSWVRMFQS